MQSMLQFLVPDMQISVESVGGRGGGRGGGEVYAACAVTLGHCPISLHSVRAALSAQQSTKGALLGRFHSHDHIHYIAAGSTAAVLMR